MKGFISVICVSLLGLTACISSSAIGSNRFKLNDPELIPFSAMYNVNREQLCLTEIDKDAEVEIERDTYAANGYHAMLHIYSGNVVRSIAFEERGDEYIWLGEQEIHRSGRKFMTIDGETDEKISVTYHRKKYNDFEGLRIRYLGDYKNVDFMDNPIELTCEDVTPYIETWDSK